jgi:hypothetical protein
MLCGYLFADWRRRSARRRCCRTCDQCPRLHHPRHVKTESFCHASAPHDQNLKPVHTTSKKGNFLMGRNKKSEKREYQHVRLECRDEDLPAWVAMGPWARLAYLRLKRHLHINGRFGTNNGSVCESSRKMAQKLVSVSWPPPSQFLSELRVRV